YGLIEDESVLWNLKLALEYKKMKKKEKLKIINEYLKQFELSDMLNKKVYQLSGGEQQRIAIIKLILQGSQIILADEPTSGLDKENEMIVMKLLKELNEKGITIIMVTHNMNLCSYFSRVINVENFR
ncbi:TPA: ATP-binding cassette domain-containing protein, partial [Enterococcus faecium]